MKDLIASILVISCFVSCSPSTQIEKSWREPGATISPGPQNKGLVIAMVRDETSRRVIEDELVKRLNNSAVASYTILPEEMLKGASGEALNQHIKSGAFTHVLLMRLADVEKEASYVHGTTTAYYGDMEGTMVMAPICIPLRDIMSQIRTILLKLPFIL